MAVTTTATFNCLFTPRMASPQEKTFCVLEFAKINMVVTVERVFEACMNSFISSFSGITLLPILGQISFQPNLA